MNYVEVVLKITDNGAAVRKRYIVYLTTYPLPVNKNLILHLFWSELQYYYIMISESKMSVAPSNEVLIISGNKQALW